MVLGFELTLRRAILAGALVCATGVLALPGLTFAQEIDLEGLLSRAVELHQSGDLHEAAALYVQILTATPGAARIRSNLGAAYAGLGRYDEAITEYRKALESIDDISIRMNLLRSLQKVGRLEQAALEAERILTAVPGDRDTALLLADCRLRLGEDQKAVDVLQPLAQASPNDKAVAYVLGTALLNLDRTAEAQVVMDRVFRDDSAESHVLMGSMQSQRQQFTAAQAEFEKARAANPRLPLVNYLLGGCLMEKGDWAGAATAFRLEVEIDPNHYESNLMLGNLLRREGKHDEALPFLTHAFRLRGGDVASQYSLGAVYLASGRLAEAKPLLEGVAAANPDHLHTHMQLAVLYVRLGQAEDAVRERATAARLQKDADSRVFQGTRERLGGILGKTEAPAEDPPAKPR